MTNYDFIEEYVTAKNYRNGAGHLLARGNKLANYSTVLCTIDHEKLTADLNVRKYSRTTGKIQSMLKNALKRHGYKITEYKDPADFTPWNYGYMGSPTWNKGDTEKYKSIFK